MVSDVGRVLTPEQRERKRLKNREWYMRNREEVKARVMTYRKANPEKIRDWRLARYQRIKDDPEFRAKRNAMSRDWWERHREERSQYNRRLGGELKSETLQAYGGIPPTCACCGERTLEFLTVDHIDGYDKSAGIPRSGLGFYRWLRRNEYPSGFQILCRNCNWAKHACGTCPHQS